MNKIIKTYKNMKTYFLSKLEKENKLNEEIKGNFDDPNKYLSINPNIIIGKAIKGPRFDSERNLIPYSVIGNTAFFEEAQNLKKGVINKLSSSPHKMYSLISNSMNTTSTSKKELKKNYIDFVDDKEIKTIFNDFNEIKHNNKNKINDFMNELPADIKIKLSKQELNLNVKNNEEKKFIKLSEFLSHKLNKKQENLLVNKIDEHRLKREFNEFMDKEVFAEDTGNKENWVLNLRKARNNHLVRNAYVNLGTVINPIWVSKRDTSSKSMDIIRIPNSKSKFDIKSIAKNKFGIDSFNPDSAMNVISNVLNNINNISVNLLNSTDVDNENNNVFVTNNVNKNSVNREKSKINRLSNMNNSNINTIQVKINFFYLR